MPQTVEELSPTQFTVYGYVRRMQNEMWPQVIPKDMALLILLHYEISEQFQNPIEKEYLYISLDHRTITKFARHDVYAYLLTFIDCTIDQLATWRFKIATKHCQFRIRFGVYMKCDKFYHGGHRLAHPKCEWRKPWEYKEISDTAEIVVTLNTKNGRFRCKAQDDNEPFYSCNIYAREFEYKFNSAYRKDDSLGKPRLCLEHRYRKMKCKLMLNISTRESTTKPSSFSVTLIEHENESMLH